MACACSTAWWPISTKAERPALALLASPLLGPGCWRAAAAELAHLGWRSAILDPGPIEPGDDPTSVGARLWAQAAGLDGGWILVAHSGAGGLAPAALGESFAGVILVDAILPHPGRSWMETAPSALAQRLGSSVDERGRLPPWNRWFANDPLAVLPPALQRKLELPRLPLSFLEAPAPPGALSGPVAYLRLSAAYAVEADAARRLGWRVAELPSHHLAMLTEPARLAGSIGELAEGIRRS